MVAWDKYMVGELNIDSIMDVIIGKCAAHPKCFDLDLLNCLETNQEPARQSKNGIERSLQELEYSKVRTLQDVIAFNEQHPDAEFDKDYCPPNDNLGHLADGAGPDDSPEMAEWLAQCRNWAAVEGIDKIVAETGVDVVVCCSDSFYAGVSVGSGK